MTLNATSDFVVDMMYLELLLSNKILPVFYLAVFITQCDYFNHNYYPKHVPGTAAREYFTLCRTLNDHVD